MKVFVAGASGVIGRVLVPKLVDAGHRVTAMTRSTARARDLEAAGARAVVLDVFDQAGLDRALADAAPEAVIHQLTSLPQAIDPQKMERQLAENDRVRTEGTRNLVLASERAGVRRFIAQSIAFALAPEGEWVRNEEAPLWLDAPWPWRRSVAAVSELERSVTRIEGADGIVLRYGYFYGPETAYAPDGSMAGLVRKRQFPVVGKGSGVFSFVHVDDAAEAAVRALTAEAAGIYHVVDDEPAPLRDWLPAYADALGAPRPLAVPAFLARVLAGRHVVYLGTEQRGAENARAKRELGWEPRWPSWREGFAAELERARAIAS